METQDRSTNGFFEAICRAIKREIFESTNPLRAVFLVLIPLSILLFMTDPGRRGDPMALTGIVTAVGGILFGQIIDRDQFKIIMNLRDAGLIQLAPERERNIMSRLRKNTLWWQCVVATVIVLCTFFSYRVIIGPALDNFYLASLMCAASIGLQFGRAAANGFTGRALEASSVSFQITIEHPDRAGGLSGIGNFYLLQAAGILIASSWLTVWIYLIDRGNGIVNGHDYALWKEYFVVLLLVCVVTFGFAMVLPMLSFRRMIIHWKAQNRAFIDTLSMRLYSLNSQAYKDASTRNSIREISRHLHCFSHISDWGISPLVTTTFLTTFLTLLLSALSVIVAITK